MKNSIDTVMKFVRRDGSLEAPLCFLTIEDGGQLEEHKFEAYINGDGHWIPKSTDRPLTLHNSGLPSEFIAKIMAGVFDHFENWSEYRANHLYSKNEINIKFYPIGRIGTSVWDSWLEEKLTLTNQEYIYRCLAERYDIIFNTLQNYFEQNRFYIILGAREEWYYFLKKYIFKNRLLRKESVYDCDSELFFDKNNTLLFAYYPMFKRGARSSEKLICFCNKIKPEILSHFSSEITI